MYKVIQDNRIYSFQFNNSNIFVECQEQSILNFKHVLAKTTARALSLFLNLYSGKMRPIRSMNTKKPIIQQTMRRSLERLTSSSLIMRECRLCWGASDGTLFVLLHRSFNILSHRNPNITELCGNPRWHKKRSFFRSSHEDFI